jgi:hypothetical protein
LSLEVSARRPFHVVRASANWKFWLFKRSTLRIAHKGNVNPLPLGPPPCVWPVKAVEVERLADCTKLVGVVEKHM